jgi:hypothetical protein
MIIVLLSKSVTTREPKKRALWLKIWHSSIEKVEEENPWALAFDETEELVLTPAEA